MSAITSIDNIRIKTAAALRQKKFRDKSGLFLIEGMRLIETAQQAAVVKDCFYTAEAAENKRAAAVIAELERQSCPVHEITRTVLNKLTDTDSPQGIIAVAAKSSTPLSDFPAGSEDATFIILDQLQDPGNVGTIIRTADAAGIDGVIAMKGTVDLFSPKVVRSTMGAIFHLPIAERIDSSALMSFIGSRRIKLMATVLSDKATPCHRADYKAAAVAFGNEGAGISREICDLSAEHVFIPMYGKSESLNASSAAAMIMYEIMRQKHFN